MIARTLTMLLSASLLAASGPADTPAVTAQMAAAARAAGTDYRPLYDLLCPASGTPAPKVDPADPQSWYAPPGRAFDNLFFVGQNTVSAWAIRTSAGIILIDSLFAYSEPREIEDGLRAMGLDPADIRYVVVTHSHADHYGGAARLQQHYGAKVVMSAEDWDGMARETRWSDPKPRREIAVRGRMVLKLGDTAITLVRTPGHTPGTLSVLFRVHDRGRDHVAVLWGGSAIIDRSPAALMAMRDSARRFARLARSARADVWLSNHPAFDDSLAKLSRGSESFVVGSAGVERALDVVALCAGAALARSAARTVAAN